MPPWAGLVGLSRALSDPSAIYNIGAGVKEVYIACDLHLFGDLKIAAI